MRATATACPACSSRAHRRDGDDDPEGWDVYDSARDGAAGEPDCHLLTNQPGTGVLEVTAFQRWADVAIQKSLREGFGLTVSEALGADASRWRLGRRHPDDVRPDDGGVLVTDTRDCASAVAELLADPEAHRARKAPPATSAFAARS